MSLYDLLHLLDDKSITINIKPDTSQRAAEPSRRWTYRCESCGYTSNTRREFVCQGGYGNRWYKCNDCDRLARIEQTRAAQIAAEEAARQIAESKRMVISAPQEEPEIVIDKNQKRPYYDPNVLRRKWSNEGR